MWLYSIVDGDLDYCKLSGHIHTFGFRYTVIADENRLMDGYALREAFMESNDIDFIQPEIEALLYQPVTLFEVMIALCDRMDFQLDDLSGTPRHPIWYAELLGNLKLADLEGDFRMTVSRRRRIDMILDNLLDRTYGPNGVGSLFPIPGTRRDLRTVELWYQLAWYIKEHHPV